MQVAQNRVKKEKLKVQMSHCTLYAGHWKERKGFGFTKGNIWYKSKVVKMVYWVGCLRHGICSQLWHSRMRGCGILVLGSIP